MAKKHSKAREEPAAGPAGLFDSRLAGAVKDSAQQIWLAGMGAFAKAQAEGGKVFESLVKDGLGLQRKTQSVAEEKLGDVAGKMGAMASEVGSKAGASWDKLENIFEERTAKALGKLGVPTARDVAELSRRVDALSAAVAQLSKPARAARPAAKKAAGKSTKEAAPAKKTAPKKVVARKTAASKAAPATRRAR